MSMETDLSALLAALCPRSYPDIAPQGVAAPYVTWQAIAGEALGYLDNTAADKRHSLMQISVWAATRMESLALVRQIEAAMRASPAFTASPSAEPASTYEHDTRLYGCIQRFSIYSLR